LNPIFPSILSSHFYDLETKLHSFASCGIEVIHLDVMDGHFVPNLSFGPAIIRDIKAIVPYKVDTHLMVSNPLRVVPWFIEAGSDWISIHIEIKAQIDDCVALIKAAGKKAGLVLNPDTSVHEVFPYLDQIDYILLMSVFPGYGGQGFITESIARIYALRKEIDCQKANCLLQVDGGINQLNAKNIVEAGADLIVVGSALYGTENIAVCVENLLRAFGEKK